MLPSDTSEIAAIGMAGCFPGASNPDKLFHIILEKREALTAFPERELVSLPFKDVAYIPKHGTIPDVEDFDPAELGLKERRSKVGFHLLCHLCKLTSVFNGHGSPPTFVQST